MHRTKLNSYAAKEMKPQSYCSAEVKNFCTSSKLLQRRVATYVPCFHSTLLKYSPPHSGFYLPVDEICVSWPKILNSEF